VIQGFRHFTRRMTEHAELFREATGECLFPGTLNVQVGQPEPIREHFSIPDPIDAAQDLQFEVCRINGNWAYRIRPINRQTGDGGHGDHILEIACSTELPNAGDGAVVTIGLFR
jgi:CTP-dependent riboflavin kinase